MSTYVCRKCEAEFVFIVNTAGENDVQSYEIKDELNAERIAKQLSEEVQKLYSYDNLKIFSDIIECGFEEGYIAYRVEFGYDEDVRVFEGSPSYNWYEQDTPDEYDMYDEDDMAYEMGKEIQKAFSSLGYNVDSWEVEENRIEGIDEVSERYEGDRERRERAWEDYCETLAGSKREEALYERD